MKKPYKFTDEEKIKYSETIKKLNDIVDGEFHIEGEISAPESICLNRLPDFMMKLFNECLYDDLFVPESYLSEMLDSLAYDCAKRAINNIVDSGCFDISIKEPGKWVCNTEEEETIKSLLWEIAYE